MNKYITIKLLKKWCSYCVPEYPPSASPHCSPLQSRCFLCFTVSYFLPSLPVNTWRIIRVKTLLSQNCDLEECRPLSLIPKEGWASRSLCPLLLLWFKSLHPCPKDSMSLGPPQPHPNAAAAAAKSCQSCPTLPDPIDGSPPGSSVHGIFQARTLEWVATAFFQ